MNDPIAAATALVVYRPLGSADRLAVRTVRPADSISAGGTAGPDFAGSQCRWSRLGHLPAWPRAALDAEPRTRRIDRDGDPVAVVLPQNQVSVVDDDGRRFGDRLVDGFQPAGGRRIADLNFDGHSSSSAQRQRFSLSLGLTVGASVRVVA